LTVIALVTPHSRHDALEAELRNMSGIEVVRFGDKSELTKAALEKIGPRYVFVAHWSWKIPAEIFDNFECIIFHMTDVPFGRGGSPLQNLIVRGIRDTKLTALRCVAEMDAGAVYMKRPLSLEGTAEEILRRASVLTGEMIKAILHSPPVPTPQEARSPHSAAVLPRKAT